MKYGNIVATYMYMQKYRKMQQIYEICNVYFEEY